MNTFSQSFPDQLLALLVLQRDFILHRIGTRSVDVTLSAAKGLATFGNEIRHFVQNDVARCSTRNTSADTTRSDIIRRFVACLDQTCSATVSEDYVCANGISPRPQVQP